MKRLKRFAMKLVFPLCMSFDRNPHFERVDRRRSIEAVRETHENITRGPFDPPD